MNKIFYTLGFLFDEEFHNVGLIHKARPLWMKGLLNGIGGKVNLDVRESAHDCMVREFEEETTVKVKRWIPFAMMNGVDVLDTLWQVDCFYACVPISMLMKIESPTDEEVKVYEMKYLRRLKTIPNVQWLIPLAVDHYKNINYKIEIK